MVALAIHPCLRSEWVSFLACKADPFETRRIESVLIAILAALVQPPKIKGMVIAVIPVPVIDGQIGKVFTSSKAVDDSMAEIVLAVESNSPVAVTSIPVARHLVFLHLSHSLRVSKARRAGAVDIEPVKEPVEVW